MLQRGLLELISLEKGIEATEVAIMREFCARDIDGVAPILWRS